jgi:hypothetical protein
MSTDLVRYQLNPVDQARAELDWMSDEDVAFVESKDPAAAVGLALLCGGGGHFYTGDHRKGIGLTAVAVAALVLGPVVLPFPLALLPFIAVAASSAARARTKAKKINKFILAKRDEENRGAAHPSAYRLLAAMSRVDASAVRDAAAISNAGTAAALAPAPTTGSGMPLGHADLPSRDASLPSRHAGLPSRYASLIDKLRKLTTLRAANVITDLERNERKIDLLSEVASGLERDALDELLFELIPLLREGTVTNDDIEFVKTLAK